jgi:hypothetical protein
MSVLEQIVSELKYSGLDKWHQAGFRGQGINVWNTEGETGQHSDIVTRRITDAAPDCNVIRGQLGASYTNDTVLSANVLYQNVMYSVENFIKTFNINVVTRSVGGGSATGQAESKFWQTLREKYNLVFFNSAGNDGIGDGEEYLNSCGGALPPDVAIYCGACNLVNGKPRRANYSSVGQELDFMNFTGVWGGTSFAAPYTAGEAAVLKDRYGEMSWEEIFKYFYMIREDMGEAGLDVFTGHGLPRFRDPGKKYIRLTVDAKTYKVDGEELPIDTSPINKEGNVFVPVRAISEGLGKKVEWNGVTKEILITDATKTVKLTIGDTLMYVNGAKAILNFAPYIDGNNRTLVPIRAIAEAFNCTVEWLQSKKMVMILEK